MSRFLTTKRIIIAFALLFVVFGLYGWWISDRLTKEGVDACAVVTRIYSREESRAKRGGRLGRTRYEKVTVHYLDYRLTVQGADYDHRVRRTKNLMTAHEGDSLLVRYLPDDPSVCRPARREDGSYDLRKRRSRTSRRFESHL